MFFNTINTGHLVVKPRIAPRTKFLVALGGSIGLLVSAALIYNYGGSMAGFDRASASREQQQLEEEVRRSQAEAKELREALARAQRSLQMEQTAFQELDSSLKTSAQEIVKLREELNFYRNILSPHDQKSGLRIQTLFIEPVTGENTFRYKLVLIQALKHSQSIRGAANFEISGVQGGQDAVFKYPPVKEQAMRVDFKYFQDIEGKFELPKNFTPQKIKVTVTPRGAQSIEEVYAWPKA